MQGGGPFGRRSDQSPAKSPPAIHAPCDLYLVGGKGEIKEKPRGGRSPPMRFVCRGGGARSIAQDLRSCDLASSEVRILSPAYIFLSRVSSFVFLSIVKEKDEARVLSALSECTACLGMDMRTPETCLFSPSEIEGSHIMLFQTESLMVVRASSLLPHELSLMLIKILGC